MRSHLCIPIIILFFFIPTLSPASDISNMMKSYQLLYDLTEVESLGSHGLFDHLGYAVYSDTIFHKLLKNLHQYRRCQEKSIVMISWIRT